jgi:L,D-transpeptidase YcbB
MKIKRFQGKWPALAIWITLLLPAVCAAADEELAVVPIVNAELKAAIAQRTAEAGSKSLRKRLEDIDAHYASRGYAPIWTTPERATAKAEVMVEILNLSYEDGLHPEDYDSFELFQKVGATSTAELVDLELHLTTAAVSYGQHMNAGRVDPHQVNRETVIYPQAISADTILSSIRKTSHLKAYLRLLAPHTPRYERLRTALAVYRQIEANGGWTRIPEGPTLKPGESDQRLPSIRRRMVEAGVIHGASYEENFDETFYDETLVEAVRVFQERTGLTRDGVIGPATLAEMNVPVSERIATMELNLERSRWMQNDFGPLHLFANLADQVIKLVKDGDTVHAELIQVGKPYHRTPVFTDEMEYLEFNPYWNVPPSIAVNEYLPKLRRNPGVLAAENIAVLSDSGAISAHAVDWFAYGRGNFPFRLRQEPGAGNALGRVKFMFPNQYNIYLHDTPSKTKFDAAQRYFSHGCLRLRDPMKMAEHILGPEGWSREEIDSVVRSGKRTVVRLNKKIPIHIVYLTSWVNKDGSVWFRKDVYSRDKTLAEALRQVRGR